MSAAPEHLPAKPSRTAFIIAFASIYLIWGSTYLGMRVAVETLPPFTLAAARYLIAGAVLFLIVSARGATRPTWRHWWDNTIAGTFLLLGGNGMVVWAEQYVPSSIAALILGISPAFMVLTEWAWPGGHRPSARVFVGLVLGLAGVAWLAAPWEHSRGGGIDLRGTIALVFACASWSFGSIFSRHVKNPAPPFVASALQMLGGGGALLITSLLAGEHHVLNLAAVSGRSWTAFAFLTLMGSLVGFSTFVWLMKHTTPARVSTYAYVNPVVAVFLGWLILDEPVTTRTVFAAAIIIAAVAIVTTQKNRQPAAPSVALMPGAPSEPAIETDQT
jgi:drug/metabolite transporter (DMT)-like permease